MHSPSAKLGCFPPPPENLAVTGLCLIMNSWQGSLSLPPRLIRVHTLLACIYILFLPWLIYLPLKDRGHDQQSWWPRSFSSIIALIMVFSAWYSLAFNFTFNLFKPLDRLQKVARSQELRDLRVLDFPAELGTLRRDTWPWFPCVGGCH